MRAEKQVRKMSRSEKRYFNVEMDRLRDNLDRRATYREGKAEGKTEEKLTIARNLLAKGSTPEFVSEITGLSFDEITKL